MAAFIKEGPQFYDGSSVFVACWSSMCQSYVIFIWRRRSFIFFSFSIEDNHGALLFKAWWFCLGFRPRSVDTCLIVWPHHPRSSLDLELSRSQWQSLVSYSTWRRLWGPILWTGSPIEGWSGSGTRFISSSEVFNLLSLQRFRRVLPF